MVNKKIVKKETLKEKRRAKKAIEDIFENNKETDKETEDKPVSKLEEETNEGNISFKFSVKMNRDGLTGDVSANGLNKEQKEVFENIMRNSLRNMSKIRPLYIPSPLYREPVLYRHKRFNRDMVNPLNRVFPLECSRFL